MTAISFIFGWPLALGSLGALIAAVLLRSWRVGLAGVLVGIPILLYVSAFSAAGMLAAVAVLATNVGCAVALRLRRPFVAAALLLPFAVLLVYLAGVVARQALD